MPHEEWQPNDAESRMIAADYFSLDCGAAQTLEELRHLAAGRHPGGRGVQAKTHLAQLTAFATFVSTHSHLLRFAPCEIVPLARNQASDGWVADRASVVAESLRRPWISRDPRPPWRPPLRLLTLPAESYSVALAGNGRTALAAGPDGIWAWNTFSGRRLWSYPLEGARVIAISRDGNIALSADGEQLHILDAATGAALAILSGHSKGIRCVSLADNGSPAASAGEDLRVRIWDTSAGTCLRTLESDARDVALSGNGKLLFSADSDNLIRVWDVASGDCLRVLQQEAVAVRANVDGRILLSCGIELCVWGVETGTCLRRTPSVWQHQPVALTPDGRIAMLIERGQNWFSGERKWSVPSRVSLQDLSSGEALRALGSSVVDAAFGSDGRTLVTASIAGEQVPSAFGRLASELEVWNTVSPEDESANEDEIAAVELVLTPDYQTTITASYNDLCISVLASDERKYLPGHTDNINCVAISPGGNFAISGACDSTLRLWDLDAASCLRAVPRKSYVNAVAFMADGRMAVSASNEIAIHDLVTGECAHSIASPDELGDAVSIALTPDDRRLLASYYTAETRLWGLDEDDVEGVEHFENLDELEYPEPAPQRSVRAFQGHESFVKHVAITSDGRRAVSASYDQTLRVWDLISGNCIHTLRGHEGFVRRVELTPDGHTAVSACEDGSIRIWSIVSGSCIAEYRFGRKVISLSAIRPDGHFAVLNAGSDIQYLRLRCVEQDPPLVTGVRLFRFAAPTSHLAHEPLTLQERFGPKDDSTAPILSARQIMEGEYEAEITVRCLWCGRRFVVPASTLDAISQMTKQAGLPERDSPCLRLSEDHWVEARLLGECPHCQAPLRFNPFIVDNRDRY